MGPRDWLFRRSTATIVNMQQQQINLVDRLLLLIAYTNQFMNDDKEGDH